MKTFILFFLLICRVQSICSQQWNQLGSYPNSISSVYRMALAGNSVFAGGAFTDAGGDPDADYLARWDSCQWSAVGSGVNHHVYTIAVSGNDVYVGGVFTEPFPFLARWDGTQWNSVGSAPIGPVHDILIDGSNVYIAGEGFVSQWNGSSWATLGTFSAEVSSLAKDGNTLYAAGGFTDAGGNPDADYIAVYDGNTWSNLGTATSFLNIYDMLVSNGELFVAGCFWDLGGNPDADNVAKWDGSNWIGLNFSEGNCVLSLNEFQNTLYSVVYIEILPSDDPYLASGIYQWDAGTGEWVQFADIIGVGWWMGPLVSDDENLYIGADEYMLIENENYPGIARWGPPDGCPVCTELNATWVNTNPICSGSATGSINITPPNNGTPPYNYNWSNGATTEDIHDLIGGNYYLTLTDDLSCSSTFHFTLIDPPVLTLNINDQPVSCYGGGDGELTVIPSGGVPGYTFLWSNGANTATINNLEAGTYTVTVMDDNGCTQSESYQVEQPDELEISLVNLNNEICATSNDGEITISISGGTNPSTAVWSNGDTGTTIFGLAPGGYSVTVTDYNDCTQTADYTILPGLMIETDLVLIHHVSCAGGTNGSISVTGSSGVPPYAYQWSNGETTSVIDTLTTGIYTVTTTDDNGCSGTAQYVVNEPLAISTQITLMSQIQCSGDSTAGLSAMASGGTSPLTALWSNGVSGFQNTNLGAGFYSVTITDANACLSMASDTITEPLPIVVNALGTNETGEDANDGTAMSIPTGGIPPFSFLWSTGDTSSTLSGLSPGIYMVTTTDANGCLAVGTAIVQAFGCTLNIIPGADLLFCSEDTIDILPIVMGGSSLSYLWSDGSTGELLSVYQGGEYCVTISDETNCQDLDCVQVTEIVIPPFNCPAIDESSPGAHDGAIQCDSLPGIISYLWSNDSTASSILGLPPGQYCVTVTDENGCMSTQCFNINPGHCQMLVNVFLSDIKCAGDSSGAIMLTIENGTDPITYTWSNGGTTHAIENLSAGNYSVTISDANGCINSISFTLLDPPPLTVAIDSIAPVDDAGSGLIWITAYGGTPSYTFQWVDPFGATLHIEDLNDLSVSGYYTLMLTDANDCVTTLDSVYVDFALALDAPVRYNTLDVYPVPAKDLLMINTSQFIHDVLIFGVDGRLEKRIIKPTSNTLDVSDLAPGWYILRISDGDNWYIAKIVK